MTMAFDNRECAKALSAVMMFAPQPSEPPVEDTVQHLPRAYVFGHYDSRGGATLVAAPGFAEAIRKYAAIFGYNEFGEDPGQKRYFESTGLTGQQLEDVYVFWKQNSLQEIEDEKLYTCEVWVCGEVLPEDGGELDDSYRWEKDKRLYKMGVLQERWFNTHSNKWSTWEDRGPNKTLILWKGKSHPKIIAQDRWLKKEYRIRKEELGEDAYGLIYLP